MAWNAPMPIKASPQIRTFANRILPPSMALQIPGEEWQDNFFHPVHDMVGVVAVVDFEGRLNAVAVQYSIQLSIAGRQAIFVAHIDSDPQSFETRRILIDHRKWGIGYPARHDCGLNLAVFGRQIEIKRWVLRIG